MSSISNDKFHIWFYFSSSNHFSRIQWNMYCFNQWCIWFCQLGYFSILNRLKMMFNPVLSGLCLVRVEFGSVSVHKVIFTDVWWSIFGQNVRTPWTVCYFLKSFWSQALPIRIFAIKTRWNLRIKSCRFRFCEKWISNWTRKCQGIIEIRPTFFQNGMKNNWLTSWNAKITP